MASLPQSAGQWREDLGRLCNRVDAQLAKTGILPEDTDTRLDILQPLEQAVSYLDALPNLPDTPAGKLAYALWIKNHPAEANLTDALSLVVNDSPLVRSVGAEALAVTLKSRARWSDPTLSSTARQIFLRQRRDERSPVVSYQLDRLLEQLPKPLRTRPSSPAKIAANPYVAGIPVSGARAFVGRQDVLDEIGSLLRPGSGVKSIVLYGARRTGKTSILYRIRESVLGESIIPVYLDMQALAGASLVEFIQALLDETRDALRARNIELGEDWQAATLQLPDLPRFFRAVFKHIEHDTSIVLLMDEYEILDPLIRDSNLARQIHHLLEHEPQFFLVFAGSRKLEALHNRNFLLLLDVSRDIRISFLSRADAIKLITAPAASQVEYEPGVIESLLTLTGGHPFYLQLLCHTLFTMADGSGPIDEAKLSAAVHHFIANPAPHLILTWNSLSLEQRAAAVALATMESATPQRVALLLHEEKYPANLRLGEIEKALDLLTQVDLVRKHVEPKTYAFTMALVRQWIIASQSLTSIGEEYRDEVLKQVAQFWRQRVAAAIDAAILLAVGFGLATFHRGTSWVWMTYVPLIAAYYTLPIVLAQSTLGQRLVHVRVVGTSARRLGRSAALRYGAALSARFLLLAVVIVALFESSQLPTLRWWQYAALIVFPVLFIADVFLTLFSTRRQGIADKLVGTVVVLAKAVRD
jgi:uncharacterized RDD family membrane protein YckC